MNAAHRLFIVGCGYVGRRLAARLHATYEVNAVVRSARGEASLADLKIPVTQLDFDEEDALRGWDARIQGASIVYLVPPPADGESDTRLHQFLHSLTQIPSALLYFSTTGVYGDAEGTEVDEATRVNPMTARAMRRVSAEEITRVWCTENEVRRIVFRVPGIYGPGRLSLERLQRREPVIRRAEAGITNRIHLDDLVEAAVMAIGKPVRGIFNITDGNACSSTDYLDKLAAATGLPLPPQISMDEARLTLPASRMSFLDESRRVGNQRMLRELGVRLKYANIEDGIRASLEEETS